MYPDEYEQALSRWRRTVRYVEVNPPAAMVSITLNCGHTITQQIASHPLISIDSLSVGLGDQIQCDQCRLLAIDDAFAACRAIKQFCDQLPPVPLSLNGIVIDHSALNEAYRLAKAAITEAEGR